MDFKNIFSSNRRTPNREDLKRFKKIKSEFEDLANCIEELERTDEYQKIFGENGWVENLIERKRKRLRGYIENTREIDNKYLKKLKWQYEKARSVKELIEGIKESREKADKDFKAAVQGKYYLYQ